MNPIQPITTAQQQEVVQSTAKYIEFASKALNRAFGAIDVTFHLKGRCAGVYSVRAGERLIRYNPYIFAKDFKANMQITVPHEVAHYLCDVLYGHRNIRPHGEQWRSMMKLFEADDSVTGVIDLEGVPQRRMRRFPYRCACKEFEITAVRHNKIKRGAKYSCRKCEQLLVASVATPAQTTIT